MDGEVVGHLGIVCSQSFSGSYGFFLRSFCSCPGFSRFDPMVTQRQVSWFPILYLFPSWGVNPGSSRWR
jgi:hypothetical protein